MAELSYQPFYPKSRALSVVSDLEHPVVSQLSLTSVAASPRCGYRASAVY